MWSSYLASPSRAAFCRLASFSSIRSPPGPWIKDTSVFKSNPYKLVAVKAEPFSTSSVRFAKLTKAQEAEIKKRSSIMYSASAIIGMVGVTFLAVPLYKMFCQATGLGGEIGRGHDSSQVRAMRKVDDTLIEVKFIANTHSSSAWNFRPLQPSITVKPGETALAFFTAMNPLPKAVNGISTYNVVPFDAAPYFNKIQCFCFEEQRLNPGEEVDLPVFFYVDPEFCEDPALEDCDQLTLSYTFFEAKPGQFSIPVPGNY